MCCGYFPLFSVVCVIWSQSATSNPSSVVGTYAGCEKDELQRHRGELESGTRLSSPTVGSRLSFCLVVLEKKEGCSVPPKGNNARFVWYRLFCHTSHFWGWNQAGNYIYFLGLDWNGMDWFCLVINAHLLPTLWSDSPDWFWRTNVICFLGFLWWMVFHEYLPLLTNQ